MTGASRPGLKEALEQITLVDGLIGPSTVRGLRHQVIRTRAAGLSAQLVWYDLKDPPRTFFEQVVQLLRPHVPGASACVGTEWWTRAQAANSHYFFHFDRDEANQTVVIPPVRSSIVYLSNAGGPTLIVQMHPADKRPPKSGVACFPRPGRFITFPGDLLHGVLPGDANRWPRVAMFVNWWGHRPKGPSAKIAPAVLTISPLAKLPVAARSPRRPREGPRWFAASRIMSDEQWMRIHARSFEADF